MADVYVWPDDGSLFKEDFQAFVVRFRRMAIKLKYQTPLADDERAILYARLEALLSVEIPPGLRQKGSQLHTLTQVITDPNFPFDEDEKAVAVALQERWSAEDEEAAAITRTSTTDYDNYYDHGSPASTSRVSQSRGQPRKASHPLDNNNDTTTSIRKPHPNHPIYGTAGIMHGILVSRTNPLRTIYLKDPDHPKTKSSHAHGHNGFSIGDWFPSQLSCWIRGIHGSPQSGIVWGPDGAYSIVMASTGSYAKLDADLGDVVFYSGSGSHENVSPEEAVETGGTRALRRSLEGRGRAPVRVLRAGGDFKGTGFKPVCGVRYDGL